jgi:hypothetical protein
MVRATADRSRSPDRCEVSESEEIAVITLGVVLLVLGFLLGIPILWTLGIIALVVGAALALLGALGRPVAGRAHYF